MRAFCQATSDQSLSWIKCFYRSDYTPENDPRNKKVITMNQGNEIRSKLIYKWEDFYKLIPNNPTD